MNRIRTRLGRATPLIGVLIIVIIVALLCAGLYVGDRYAESRAKRVARPRRVRMRFTSSDPKDEFDPNG